jgi:hypothetical protein
MKSRSVIVSLMLAAAATWLLTDVARGAEQPAPLTPPVNVVVPPDPDASPFLSEDHFVMHWLLLGPFSYAPADFEGDEYQAVTSHAFVDDEAGLDGSQPAPDGARWERRRFEGAMQAGQVDLHVPYGGDTDYAAAYAVAILHCDEPMEKLQLWVGSDDYLQIWLNGELIHTYDDRRRGADWDQDLIDGVTLQAGDNRVVVKCIDVSAGWEFYFRLTDEQDNPLVIQSVVEEDGQ